MNAQPHRKRGIIVGGLGFVALVMCVACAGLAYFGWNLFRPISETPSALSSAIPISSQPLEKLEPLYQFTITNEVHALAWSPDSRLLAIRTEKWPAIPIGQPIVRDSLYLWNIVNGNGGELFSISSTLRSKGISSVAFSADGQILAFRTGSSIILWDVPQNRELRTLTDVGGLDAAAAIGVRPMPVFLQIPGSKSTATSLSPNGKIAAASFYDPQTPNIPKVGLFDAASGEKLRDIAGSPVVIFSHNGKMIASSDWSKMVERQTPILLSDVDSGQVIQRLEGNVYSSSVVFSPDDNLIAGVNFPARQVYVWDAPSGKKFTLKRGFGMPECVVFSPDGRFLAIGTDNGTVQVWGVRP